jgi:uncharacterized protein
MLERDLIIPKDHFFLFGPRGTGKTTWLKEIFKPDVYIDLLYSENFLEFSNDPSLLRARLTAKLSKKNKVVIDEIQRIPILLNEVHALIEQYPYKFQFALTGSSARKLRRSEANLLAGRALTRHMFPFTKNELKNRFHLEDILRFGSLPKLTSLVKDEDKIDFLYSYAQTYIKEEIQQEALIRNLPNYVRFLKHLSLYNGQVLNLSNISREASISRAPLENYMSILIDTLMGSTLEPIHLKAKVKEVSTPKFYFFDCGIIEALSGNLGEPISDRVGLLFETIVFNELKAYSEYSRKRFEIHFWSTPSGNEVDFICTKGKKRIGIEVKYSKKWKPEFSKGLRPLLDGKLINKAFVVMNLKSIEKHDDILALPFSVFSKLLYEGNII